MPELFQDTLNSSLIPTKVASEISGYNADYLARLCREKKIEGTQVGRSWLINRSSLEVFVAEQEDRKKQRAEELRTQRGKEYRRAQKPILKATLSKTADMRDIVTRSVADGVAASRAHATGLARTARRTLTAGTHSSHYEYSPKLAALAVALAVVAGTAYASTDARILMALNTIPNTAVRIALRTSPTTLESSSSFRITEADVPTNLAQSVPTVPTVHEASRTVALLMPNANVAVLSSVRDLTDTARAPFAQTNVAAVASARIASVSDIAAHPGASLIRAYVQSGESLYTVGATIANAYVDGITTAGDRTLARAATLRDGIAYIPHLTNALLDGYANGIYAWNDAASKAPTATMLALYSIGDSISAHTAAVPALALQEQNRIAYNAGETAHTGAVMLAAAMAPSVDAQYASSSAQSPAIASVGAITQPFTSAYGTAVNAGGAILSLPVKAENTILGVAGYASSLVDGNETSSALASAGVNTSAPAPASSAVSASAVSFLPLSWQQAIGNLFHSVGTLAGAFLSSTFHSLAFLFPGGSVMAPTLTVLHTGPTETLALPIPTGVAHGGGDVAISTDNRTIIQNVVNNYFPTGLVGGAFDNAVLAVVRPFVNDSINASLKNNRGSGGSSSVTTSTGGVNSDGATLTNVTISSGNATVTSLTASNSSLGTASATTFTAGTTTVGTTTVNGNLTITGTITAGSLSVGSLSYSGAVVAPSFQATDTAATSSFTTLEATKGVFTTLTVGTDAFTSLLGNGLVNLGGLLSVSTSSFSGSGSNFNADLLDGYDSAYLLANSFSTSSANAWMTSQTTDALAEGTINQYFTNARARSAISVSGSSLSYASTTGILSVASGYSIPLTASTTDWNTAYLSRITVANAPLSILNNTLSLSQASASTDGYLSSTDFNTFNSKQAALTFTYPLVNSANTISLAFGTTTVNSWSALQTFSAGINVGASTFTSLLGTGLSNVGGALTVSTTSFSGAGSKLNADLLDNLDSTYFLANSFSTTSADYYKSARDFFSTTSAAYFLSQNQGAGYSTTSANYWLTTKTTDNLAQGSTNKYYSDTLARAAISVSGLPLTYSAGVIGINQANGSQAGYLSSTDWNTFNGKQNALTFTYPLINSANTVSLAFGTSTSNTWGGTQTFTNAPVLGSLTGFLKATAGVLSTSLIDLSTDVSSTLPVSHGGTGSTSLTGILKGNGTGSLQTAVDGADYLSPSTFGSSFYTYFHATTTDALAQGSTNKYYSDTLARAAISSNAVGLTYTAGSGILSLTSGYTIPLTASTTNWDTYYATPSTRITAGTNLSWAGNTLNGPSDSYIHNLFSAASPLSYNAGTGAFTFSTSSISGAGSNFNADFLDGLDSTYFLANSFGTTSANYWLTTKSTTNLAEGTNLYFTPARADARINATSTIGTLTSTPNLGTVKTTLTGILKATSGVLSNAVAGTDYESPLTFTYPLQRTTNTISLAFGTTTANSWSALQTFSAGINVGASTFTSLLGTGLSNVGGALTIATSSFSGPGSNFNADLLDGLDSTYFLANAFSTTSAAYWKTQNNFYSTTSADFWLTGKSTTNLAEGTNLYYTASRVAGVIAGTTTDALAEGSANLYFTSARATANFVSNLAATTSVNSITTLANLSLPLTQTTGTLAQGRGGTGITTYTAGDILYADNSGNLAVLPVGATGQVLKVQAGLPSWGIDQTVGGGGSDGIFATSSGKIYPLDTSNVLLVGTNATSTTNSIFEVNGIQYISSKLGIATTSPSAALSVAGNGLFSGTVTSGNIIDSGLTTNSLLYADASKQLSSATLGTGLSFTGGALSVSTSTISGSGSLFNADLLDGLDSTYFLANAFGTTSANYWLTTKSTTNLAEGSNLYYTDARVNTYVAASTTIPKTYTSNVFSGNNTFNGSLSVGTLNGPLQANGGVVSATSSIGVLYGGTGLTTAPTYGQILTGNGSGGYALTATSSLGLAAAFTATYPIQYSGNVLSLAFGTTTANAWSALQTFSAGINVSASTFTSLLGTGLSNVGGALTVATSSFSGSGSNFNADLLDGLDSTYFLANSFSTTSATYWKTQNNFYSTTSADYWLTGKTTTNLAEGSNLYYTNARADARINATSTIGTLTSAPNLGTLSTTLTGILKATSGVLSNAVAGTDYENPLTFTYPLTRTTNTISLAFGTTTANAWSALQTFNAGVKVGSLSGVLYGNSGTVAASATSTPTLGTGLTYSGTLGSFVGGTSGTLSISTSTISGSGSNFNADFLDGLDSTYFLANAFSTTSANYWKTQNNFYSTTSADFWLTGKSTTNLTEGTNLYYTASRVAGVIAGTTTDALAQGSVNKYYSDTLARAALSSTATGLTYTSGTGVFSLTAGYTIPLTASTTDWNTAYLNRIASVSSPLSFTGNVLSIAQAGTGSDGYLSSTDWNSFNSRLSTTTLGLFDKGYFFSTTSASYFLSQNQGAGYSTTSANYWLTTKSTTDLAEGTNLYYTDARADGRVNATSTIGTLTSAPNLGTVKTSLTGILKATSGVLSNAVAGTDYENPLTFTYPLTRTTNTISLAFGTTTANAWSALQTFNSIQISGNTFTSLLGFGLSNVGGALSVSTTSFSGSGSNFNADFLDGYDSTAFLANAFSTTSADYWKTQRNFYSTTSADYWLTGKTTDNLTEGTTNLYWTNTRFDNRLSATTTLPSLTTLANLGTVKTSLTGILKATSGVLSAATAGIDYENPLTFGYPLVRTTNAISLAFGTTTANTWSSLQTFTSGINALGNSTLANATSTNLFSGRLTANTTAFGQTGSTTIASTGALTTPSLTIGSLSGLLKASSGVVSTAVSGTDYAPATVGSSILAGNGTGGFSAVSVSSPLTFSLGVLGIQQADNTQPGYLSSTDWSTFNGKQDALTFTYPLVNSANAISLAFGTTTANTWSAANNFTATLALGSTSPWGTLSVDTTGASNPNFVVGSSAGTNFLVDANGYVAINSTTAGTGSNRLVVNGSTVIGGTTNVQASTLYVNGNGFFTSQVRSNVVSAGAESTGLITANWSTSVNTAASLGFEMEDSGFTPRTYARIGAVTTANGVGTFAGDLYFKTSTGGVISEQARLTGAGNFGIGTTSPFAKLSVAGDIALTGGIYDNNATRGTNGQVLQTTGTGVQWVSTSTLGFAGPTVGTSLLYGNGSGGFSNASVSSPLTFSAGVLGIQKADNTQPGYLSSTDWSTFNGKQDALTFTYPLVNTTNTISLAFGTTTANAWSSLQTFNGGVKIGSLSGVLYGNSGTVAASATSTPTLGTGLSYSGTLGSFVGGTSGTLSISTSSFSGPGSNFNADLLDGQDGTYYLNRANHTGTQLAATISDFSTTARGLLSSTATGLTYTSGTGVFSLTAGYNIPLTASTTDWNTAYLNRITSATYPLQISSNAISLAFGTTTANSWSSLQTFNGGITTGGTVTLGSLTGVLHASSGVVSAGNVNLGTEVTGTLPVANGGTGSTTLSGLLKGNGTGGVQTAIAGTDYQAPGNYITALTGDVTASGPGSAAATLATVNSNVGSFGGSTAIPTFTVNAKGLITAAGSVAVIAPAGTLTGTTLASNVVSSSLTSVGTLSALTVSGNTTLANATSTNEFSGRLTANTAAFGQTGSTTVSSTGALTTPSLTVGSLSGVLKAASGVVSVATAGTDYQAPISLTTTGSSGAATFIGNTLNIPQYQAAGTYVTSISIASANGFTGSSSGGATPALTIGTSVTGLLKGNGTAISAATAGTDYENPLTFGYPLVRTTNAISLAFGTTTANTWSALQQFNGNASTTQLSASGLIYAGNIINNGLTANSLTYANGSKQEASVTLGTGLSLTTGTLSISTSTFSGSGSNFNADLLDGLDSTYFLNRANHTGTQLAATISDFSTTARGLFSSAATGLTYTSGTGVFSLTAGYNIPLTASTTDWNTAYLNRITSATYPLQISSNAISLAFGTTTANSWSQLQTFSGGIAATYLGVAGAFFDGSFSAGTNGQILQTTGSIVQWVSTSTLGLGTGTVTSVNASGGTTGLSFSGGPITTSGSLTLAGTLAVANGGTGSTTLTGLLKGNGTGGVQTAVAGTDYQAPLTFSYPLVNTANTISLAFGTTTANSWSALQTFNGGVKIGSLSGVLYGNNGTVASVATSSATLGLGLSGALTTLGSSDSLSIATSSLFSGTTGQFPYFSGTNTLTATSSLFLATSGNIGIGTTSPISQLTLDSSSAVGQLYINNTGASNNISINLARNNTVKALAGIVGATNGIVTGSALDDFAFRTAGGNILFSTDSGSTAQLYLKNGGNVGIGTTTPAAKLALAGGNFLQSVTVAPVVAGSVSITSASNGIGTYVQGHYAYSVDAGSGFKLSVIDITVPTAPVVVGTVSDVTNLAGAFTVKVAGNYAYVTATTGGRLTVVDISNPSSPFVAGVLTNSALGGARGLYLSGRYAYVAGNTSGALAVVDITNPTAPTLAGSVTSAGNLDAADSVFVSGKYAYVTSTSNNKMAIVDITNPAAPTVAGSYASVTNISNPKEVWVSGRYAYVLGQGSNSLAVIDVSTPSAPTLTGVLFDGTNLNNPKDIFVAGRYAYITSNSGNRLTVVDISNPAAPFVASSLNDGTNLNNPRGIFISGKYAYVSAGSKFTVVDIAGIDVPSANLGVANTEALSVYENGDIGNDLYVRNGLTVGTGGILSNGALSVLGNAGVNPFTVASSTGTNLLTLSQTGNLGIGTSSPFAALSIAASAGIYPFAIGSSTNPVFTVLPSGGVSVGTIAETIASSGFLNTRGDLFASGSLAAEGVIYTDSGLNLNGASILDSSANLLNLGGTIRSASGNGLSFQTNGASTARLVIDTSGNVGIGTSTPYAQLSLGGGDLVLGAATAGGTPGDLFLPKLGTSAGSFLAVDASGKVISTTTPSSSLTGTTGQVAYFSGTNTAVGTSTLFISTAGKVGIGTTVPSALLHITGTQPAAGTSGTGAQPTLTVAGITGGDNSANSGFATGGAGSAISLTAGNGGAIIGTPATGFGGAGGTIAITAGNGGAGGGTSAFAGAAGNVTISAGLAGNTSGGTGGSVTITAGGATGAGTLGGNIYISGGAGTSNPVGAGNIILGVPSSVAIARGFIGIGTTTPWGLLSVDPETSNLPSGAPEFVIGSSTATHLLLTAAGNLGLGTTSPYAQLSLGGGNLVLGAVTAGGTPGDLFLPKLGTTAGSFLAVDANGMVIATTTPAGGGSLTGTTGQVAYFSGTNTAVGTSALFIDGSGNIGIGTTTPDAKLTFNPGTGDKIHYYSTAAQEFGVGIYSSELRNFAGAGAFTTWGTQDGSGTFTELARLTAGGNLGLGTTTPVSRLSLPQGTTAAGGINFGDSTANLYRSSTGTIKTDGGLIVATGVITGLTPAIITTGGFTAFQNVDNAGLNAIAGSGSAITETVATGLRAILNLGGVETWAPNSASNSAIFNGLLVQPTLNAGGSNVGGTFYAARINPTITSTTGLTAAYLFAVGSGSSDKFVIDTSGNVGVGTTSPYAKLSIAGDTVLGAATAGGIPGDLFLPKLGTGAGAFLAVDATGKVIATTTPTGGGGLTGSTGQVAYFSGTNTAVGTSTLTISTASNLGVGTTTPWAGYKLAVNGTQIIHPTTNYNLSFDSSGISAVDDSGALATFIATGGTATLQATADASVKSLAVGAVRLSTAAGEKLTITSGGLVGISTTTPTSAFSVGSASYLGGAVTIESNSATALAVGRVGASNPAFSVDASTGSSVTGLNIKSGITGGTTALIATDSGTNSSLTINAKGSGSIGLGTTGTGAITVGNNGGIGTLNGASLALQAAGTTRLSIATNQLSFSTAAAGSAGTVRFLFTGAADTGMAGSAEATDVQFNLGQVRSHSAGTIVLQRDFRITPSSHAFASASSITTAAALAIDSAPIGGTNATISTSTALFLNGVGSGLSNVTNGYALVAYAPTGATNNYAATFATGNVGIGTTSPWRTLAVTGTVGLDGVTSSNTGNFLCLNTTTKEVTQGTTCTLSTQKVKNSIQALAPSSGLDDITRLNPVSFLYDKGFGDNGSTTQIGFIAEQASAVNHIFGNYATEAFNTPNGMVNVGDPNGINWNAITAASVLAIKQLASTTNQIAVSNASLSANFASLQDSVTLPHALTATAVTADSIAIAQGVSAGTLTTQSANVDGTVSAARYVVPLTANVFSFGSTTINMHVPSEALASGGNVDLYKLAGYAAAGTDALAARTDLLAIKLDDLTTRIAALEALHAATTTASTTDGTSADGALGLTITTIQDALKGLGIIIHKGYLALDSLVTHQLFLVKGEDGTSSTGSQVIPAGATTLNVTNPLVHPSSKIFLTFTSSVDGSWYLSKKQEGSFTITLAKAQPADTEFDYFLLQTDPNAQVAAVDQANQPPAGSSEAPSAPASVSQDGGPVVSLNGEAAIQLAQGAAWTDPGAHATAADGTDLTSSITVAGSVDTNTAGLYTLTYNVVDASGKGGQASRVVSVLAPTSAPSGGSTSGTTVTDSSGTGSSAGGSTGGGTTGSTGTGTATTPASGSTGTDTSTGTTVTQAPSGTTATTPSSSDAGTTASAPAATTVSAAPDASPAS